MFLTVFLFSLACSYGLVKSEGPFFQEGTNTTVSPNLIVGSDATLRCTVNESDPDVVKLDMLPPPSPEDNWKITHDETGKKWVEVVITNVSHKNAMNFTCFANNSETISFLTYELLVYNGTTFKEGTNTTIASQIVTGFDTTFRCTVDQSDPPVVELSILPLPVGPEDNWKIKTNGTEWIEVIITKASNMTSKIFDCLARNNVTTSFLTYELSLVDPDGPYFIEGNYTVWSELAIGSNTTLSCTVSKSIPPVTELEYFPLAEPESNWVVKKNDTYSIEVVITNATLKNTMDFVCVANNTFRIALLEYQNFVGGPPEAVNVSVDLQVTDNIANFSITVTDNSAAPAKEILVYLEGTTEHNTTLTLSYPLVNGSKYTFTNFLTESVEHLGTTDHVLKVYAKNTLGDVHVKDITFALGAPYFSEGTNTTVWSEIRTGSNVSLKCTVHNSLPPVTELEIFPPTEPESNWIVKRNGTHSIEMVITNANSEMNTMDFICSAGNGIRIALLVYQNFVGGPPDAVNASLDVKVTDDKARFSITVSDNSSAPAKEILYYLEGTTKSNESLTIPYPLINVTNYTFTNFMTESTSHFGNTERVLIVYANNTLGTVHVRNFTFTVPSSGKHKITSNSGTIAAGILVPLIVISIVIVVGVAGYCFWKKKKSKRGYYSQISTGYGALSQNT